MSKITPRFVTKKLAHVWQPFVSKQIRTNMTGGLDQDTAVEIALDARDKHIKNGDRITKSGRIIKKR